MKILFCVAVATILAIFLPETNAEHNRVVCYYGSWAVYRPSRGKFDVEDIDPTLCTHLIYTFVGLGTNGQIKVLDAWNDLEEDYGLGAFKRFVKLKQRNPKAKTMVAIGGWNEGSKKYSNMVSSDDLRAKFVQSAVAFLKKYGFDGLDLDWEYPNQRGGVPSDVINYVKLIKELRDEFDKHGYLLSAAVAAAEFSMSLSYDVPMLSRYLDFINVMAYDLHGTWDGFTGNNAPLYPSSKDVEETSKQLNVKACIEVWIAKGADPSKIVLGMGTYGRSFTLNDPKNTGLYSPSSQPGAAGMYTEEAGMLGYNEIVEYIQKRGWTVVWDDEQKVPYAFKGNQWVGYDTPESITIKMQFAKKMGLGGGMIWSIDTDDFHGVTGTKFPILRAINDALGNDVPTEPPITEGPSTSHKPTTTTEPSGTTTVNPNDPAKLCKEPNTYVRDPKDCAKFYYCVLVNDEFRVFEFSCTEGLVFDPKTNSCNYPWLVEC